MIITAPEHRTFYLSPGETLTVVADAVSAGTVWRLGDSAGGANQSPTSVAASESKTLGPFTAATRFDVIPSAGSLTVTQGIASVASALASLSGLVYKGVLDCSSNPNFPAANAGDLYVVSVAGKAGGASGVTVDAGDLLLCKTTGIAGTQAGVGANWDIVQTNLVAAYVLGGTDVAVADGGTGASTAADARTNLGLGTLATQSGTFSGTSSGTNTGDQALPVKASGAEVNTGTDDAKFVTAKAIEDSDYAKTAAITVAQAEANSSITPCADGTVTPVTSITTVKGIITAIS